MTTIGNLLLRKTKGKKPFMRKTIARLESVLAGAGISNQHDATDTTYETKEYLCYSKPTISIPTKS